jgi:CRISPR-associated protein Cst2
MAFLTGLILLDAPASALNNAGSNEDLPGHSAIAVKYIRSRGQGVFPYVSAQAFRYWLRNTLEHSPELKWKTAPVFREGKIVYTDANPLEYWDDDLFGYMRFPSKKTAPVREEATETTRETETPINTAVTRISPFRVSTLVSLAPVVLTSDFGVMARQEGNPAPNEHQFYRATLKGLLSIDLHAAGTFSYMDRAGYRNLDGYRIELARKRNLERLDAGEKAYRLPWNERCERIAALLNALGTICGGAQQSRHYTDVTPTVFIGMISKGGNNPLQYLIGADEAGQPAVRPEAVQQSFRVWSDQILSKVYVGWVQGFCDSQREQMQRELERISQEQKGRFEFQFGHPREVLGQLGNEISSEKHADWLK